jgi:hypothetical protein
MHFIVYIALLITSTYAYREILYNIVGVNDCVADVYIGAEETGAYIGKISQGVSLMSIGWVFDEIIVVPDTCCVNLSWIHSVTHVANTFTLSMNADRTDVSFDPDPFKTGHRVFADLREIFENVIPLNAFARHSTYILHGDELQRYDLKDVNVSAFETFLSVSLDMTSKEVRVPFPIINPRPLNALTYISIADSPQEPVVINDKGYAALRMPVCIHDFTVNAIVVDVTGIVLARINKTIHPASYCPDDPLCFCTDNSDELEAKFATKEQKTKRPIDEIRESKEEIQPEEPKEICPLMLTRVELEPDQIMPQFEKSHMAHARTWVEYANRVPLDLIVNVNGIWYEVDATGVFTFQVLFGKDYIVHFLDRNTLCKSTTSILPQAQEADVVILEPVIKTAKGDLIITVVSDVPWRETDPILIPESPSETINNKLIGRYRIESSADHVIFRFDNSPPLTIQLGRIDEDGYKEGEGAKGKDEKPNQLKTPMNPIANIAVDWNFNMTEDQMCSGKARYNIVIPNGIYYTQDDADLGTIKLTTGSYILTAKRGPIMAISHPDLKIIPIDIQKGDIPTFDPVRVDRLDAANIIKSNGYIVLIHDPSLSVSVYSIASGLEISSDVPSGLSYSVPSGLYKIISQKTMPIYGIVCSHSQLIMIPDRDRWDALQVKHSPTSKQMKCPVGTGKYAPIVMVEGFDGIAVLTREDSTPIYRKNTKEGRALFTLDGIGTYGVMITDNRTGWAVVHILDSVFKIKPASYNKESFVGVVIQYPSCYNSHDGIFGIVDPINDGSVVMTSGARSIAKEHNMFVIHDLPFMSDLSVLVEIGRDCAFSRTFQMLPHPGQFAVIDRMDYQPNCGRVHFVCPMQRDIVTGEFFVIQPATSRSFDWSTGFTGNCLPILIDDIKGPVTYSLTITQNGACPSSSELTMTLNDIFQPPVVTVKSVLGVFCPDESDARILVSSTHAIKTVYENEEGRILTSLVRIPAGRYTIRAQNELSKGVTCTDEKTIVIPAKHHYNVESHLIKHASMNGGSLTLLDDEDDVLDFYAPEFRKFTAFMLLPKDRIYVSDSGYGSDKLFGLPNGYVVEILIPYPETYSHITKDFCPEPLRLSAGKVTMPPIVPLGPKLSRKSESITRATPIERRTSSAIDIRQGMWIVKSSSSPPPLNYERTQSFYTFVSDEHLSLVVYFHTDNGRHKVERASLSEIGDFQDTIKPSGLGFWDQYSVVKITRTTTVIQVTFATEARISAPANESAIISLSAPVVPLTLTCDVTTKPSCPTCSDGVISVFVSGGVSPFLFVWNDLDVIQSNAIRTGLAPGVYILTVLDASGKEAPKCINSVTSPPQVIIGSVNIEQTTGCGASTVSLLSLTLEPPNAVGSFTFGAWNADIDINITSCSDGRLSVNRTMEVLAGGRNYSLALCDGSTVLVFHEIIQTPPNNQPFAVFQSSEGLLCHGDNGTLVTGSNPIVTLPRNFTYPLYVFTSNLISYVFLNNSYNQASITIQGPGPVSVWMDDAHICPSLVTLTWDTSGNATCGTCSIGNVTNTSCYGCDGIPYSGKVIDDCNVCGGNSSCIYDCVIDGSNTVTGAVAELDWCVLHGRPVYGTLAAPTVNIPVVIPSSASLELHGLRFDNSLTVANGTQLAFLAQMQITGPAFIVGTQQMALQGGSVQTDVILTGPISVCYLPSTGGGPAQVLNFLTTDIAGNIVVPANTCNGRPATSITISTITQVTFGMIVQSDVALQLIGSQVDVLFFSGGKDILMSTGDDSTIQTIVFNFTGNSTNATIARACLYLERYSFVLQARVNGTNYTLDECLTFGAGIQPTTSPLPVISKEVESHLPQGMFMFFAALYTAITVAVLLAFLKMR